jgi:hypothetical protein
VDGDPVVIAHQQHGGSLTSARDRHALLLAAATGEACFLALAVPRPTTGNGHRARCPV